MPIVLVVTRDVESRYRGFLSSCMLEVSAGVYVAPDMAAGVRDRVWDVVSKWHASLQRGSIFMGYKDSTASSGLAMRLVGAPLKEIVDVDGMFMALSRTEETGSL